MSILGYARTSTVSQIAGLEHQVKLLTEAGCDRIYSEQVSSVIDRPELDRLLDRLSKGDVVVVTTMSRLARSVLDLNALLKTLEDQGASLRILDLSIDTATAQGRMLLNMLAAISQMERELLLERQKVGIAKAKAEGKYKGRSPTAQAKADQIVKLANAGLTREEIAQACQVGIASVYRALKSHREAAKAPV